MANPYAGKSLGDIKSSLIASGMSADEAGGRAADIHSGAWGGPFPGQASTGPKPSPDFSKLPNVPTPAVMPTLPAPDFSNLEKISTKESLVEYLNMFQGAVAKFNEQIPEVRVPTMEELETQVAPPGGRPELLDRAGKREELRLEYGISDLEDQLNKLKGDEEELYAAYRTQYGIEEGKPVALGVISGRITEEERQMMQRVDFITRTKARVVDELNTKYSIVDTYMKDIGLDYNDAVAQYENDFQNNLQMYKIMSGKESEQIEQIERGVERKIDALYQGVETYYEERKQVMAESKLQWQVTKDQWDAATQQIRDQWDMSMDVWDARMDSFKTKWGMEMDVWDMGMDEQKLFLQEEQMRLDEKARVESAARANLQTYANMVTAGNLDVNNLADDQKLLLNKLEIQAGFSPGFVSSLRMNPKDKILATTAIKGVIRVLTADRDGNMSLQSYGTQITGDDKVTTTDRAVDMDTMLRGAAGGDGYVSPADWKGMRDDWRSVGLETSTFDSRFSNYVNPSHPQDYEGQKVEDKEKKPWEY